jgi:hypothetical protein
MKPAGALKLVDVGLKMDGSPTLRQVHRFRNHRQNQIIFSEVLFFDSNSLIAPLPPQNKVLSLLSESNVIVRDRRVVNCLTCSEYSGVDLLLKPSPR